MLRLGSPESDDQEDENTTSEDDKRRSKELQTEKRKQYLEDSLCILTQANELYRTMNQTGHIDDQLQALAAFNFMNTAHVAALLGKSDVVLNITKERLETKTEFPWLILSEVIDALQKYGKFSTILDLLKLLPKMDVIWYLAIETAESAQEAAIREGEGQYMLELYDEAQKTVGTWSVENGNLRARLESSAATFARQAQSDLDLAKTLLRGMIKNPRTPKWRVLGGCNELAEILFEDFRLSNDPVAKQRALDEALKLLEKAAEILPEDFNAAESHLIITTALMLRRLGPALELSDRLDAAFKNCLGDLRDDTGVNDVNALRRLARVLSCIPGFEEAASISLTAQFYIIDEDVHRKELQGLRELRENETQVSSEEDNKIVNGVDVQGGVEVEHGNSGTVQSLDAVVDGDANHNAPIQDSINGNTKGVESVVDHSNCPPDGITTSATVMNEMGEGLVGTSTIWCNFCGEHLENWHSPGPAYLCVYCIDMDICEKCYLEKIARESGEMEPDWRVICPKGHRHVKAPVEGWRGIKGGRMRIGAEEVLFKTWLAQLEVKWAKYWEDFWTEAETM